MSIIWNPWHGCHKKSEGCANCYMFFFDSQRGQESSRVYRVKNSFDLPVRKDKNGRWKVPSGELVYTCMTSDFFIKEADEWRGDVWKMIEQRQDILFHIFTKRPERIKECLPENWGDGWNNVWLSVSTENQKRADERIPILKGIPLKYRGIIAAPLLEGIDIEKYLQDDLISIVSAGGENYDGARPCDYQWVKNLYDQCVRADINFEFHQTGANFIKNGKRYYIPKKKQREQAVKSGLRHKGREIKVNLKEVSEQKKLFD